MLILSITILNHIQTNLSINEYIIRITVSKILQWCFKGKCVPSGNRPEAVNGGWGNWGDWTKCSRTCGVGITFQERPCNNPAPEHGGRYCLGERKRAKLCNTDVRG